MRTSNIGIQHIKDWEQLRLKAYKPLPNDRWTIGYGNTFYEDGTPVRENDVITVEEAEKLLRIILAKFENSVNRYVTSNINQSQFDALVSFAYNVGSHNLKRSTLLRVINYDPNDLKEIERQFMRWVRSKGRIIKGLINRRKSEFELYASN
ncbi:lysozyme [Costertonia aggregata]|uniref:Lysozyme n=1 Tax=Costertonia aggregata TaxID=343403 RepID=A0A7H9ARJ5_9FLAO|nr:lysozyme [Costertonia aggregata]QLG46064.1 lysozyme [Costertonia aggregata]